MGKMTPTKNGIIVDIGWEDLQKIPVVYNDNGELKSLGTLNTAISLGVMSIAAQKYPALRERILKSAAKIEIVDNHMVITLTSDLSSL